MLNVVRRLVSLPTVSCKLDNDVCTVKTGPLYCYYRLVCLEAEEEQTDAILAVHSAELPLTDSRSQAVESLSTAQY